MAAFAMALATLVVIGFFSYRNWRQFRTTAARVQAARRVVSLNQNLLNHMLDAETGQRGFLLTGRPEYLEPYNAARAKVQGELKELLSIANENIKQPSRLVQFQSVVGDKLSELQNTVELRRSVGLDAALAVVQTGQGKELMDRLRQFSAEIDADEYADWQAGWNSLESDAQRLRILTLMGAFLLVWLVGGGVAAVQRSAAELDRTLIQLAAEKKSAEQTRDLVRATLYSIGDGVITTDSHGEVQMMNAVAEALTGYSEKEARGQRVEAVFHIVNQLTRAKVENPVARVLRDGVVVSLANHTVLISKSGANIPIDDSGAPIVGEPGRPSGVVLVFRDVSERYQAQEAARQLASIVENSDDAIIGKTLDGTVTNWNRAAERLFGYTAAEMIGTPISRIIPPERADEVKRILDQVREGKRLEHHETERVTKGGRRVSISLTVSPIRDGDGRVVGASKIARDITGQREMEERLRQSQKMEALGQLAGGVAHDFNNLLTVINGYATLALQRLPPGDAWRHHFSHIETAGKRAVALTQQLLAFSRKQMLQPRPLSMNTIVQAMEPMLTRMIREDVSFRLTLDPQLPATEADAHQMEQILMNLVINAADAMPGGGKIQIETRNTVLNESYCAQRPEVRPGKYVMLAVSDTGIGMDAATQERIFEPFFTTKPVGKGTGLGLSTVYGIVKQTGGHIAVYSELNLGTTFRVYLPASALPVPEESSKPKITTLHGTESILLVEDDAGLREYASGVLRDFGYQVYEAASGEEAIAIGKAKVNDIDLLVTDVVMPEMGGRDLTDALASVGLRIRVLYMSGYTEAAIVHRGVLDPGIEFLAKPFSPDELAMKVREVLATPLRPRSILIVDDDAGILSLLTAILTDAGYQVSAASNGNEAISHCRGKVVDLLITDLVMPEREGIETIRYFRKEVPYAKIIAISGAFDGQMLGMADVLGAHATFQKPIRPDELLGGVRRLIG